MSCSGIDPAAAQHVLEKFHAVRQSRDNAGRRRRDWRAWPKRRTRTARISMPYLVECCHSYATVGEMVERLKGKWGEFQEPIGL